jgi:hypothetical protein
MATATKPRFQIQRKPPTQTQIRVMVDLLAALPNEDQRTALQLYYSEALRPETVCQRTGMTPEAFSALRANVRSQYLQRTGRLCQ